MSETFIELVPRSASSLRQSMTELEEAGIPFDGYNIPELVRPGQPFLRPEDVWQLRSEEYLSPEKKLALHLRTRERSVEASVERVALAARNGVHIALLVTGDPVTGVEDHGTLAHDVVSTLAPSNIRIGVAADVYQPNWGRWQQKESSIGKSVDSVFTQPVFSTDFLQDIRCRTQHLLSSESLYVGLTWMNTDRSRRYWHERNGIPMDHLPKGNCDATIAENSIAQSADVLRAIRHEGYSTYIMLMRHTVDQLEQIFLLAENIREM